MSRELRALTWWEFDQAMDKLAVGLRRIEAPGIYGPPRGGLVVAVCLSHRLGLPVLERPTDGMIWADDIIDSGKTMAETGTNAVVRCAWFSRTPRPALFVEQCEANEWLVFPWERVDKAAEDLAAYEISRQ